MMDYIVMSIALRRQISKNMDVLVELSEKPSEVLSEGEILLLAENAFAQVCALSNFGQTSGLIPGGECVMYVDRARTLRMKFCEQVEKPTKADVIDKMHAQCPTLSDYIDEVYAKEKEFRSEYDRALKAYEQALAFASGLKSEAEREAIGDLPDGLAGRLTYLREQAFASALIYEHEYHELERKAIEVYNRYLN